MTNRKLIIALGMALALVGPTFAQEAPAIPPVESPMVTTEEVAVSPMTFTEPGPCCSGGQHWVTADYLIAWMRGDNIPGLVTTSPAGTPQQTAGILGQSSTTVLLGGTANADLRSGFRLGTGYWFTPQKDLGVEAGFSMLESQATLFNAASNGSTILARPYTDANTGLPQAQLIGFPGSSSGAVNVRIGSDNFYEAHFDFVEKVIDTGFVRLESLVGYRFYSYGESLRIQQQVTPTNPNFVPGTQISTGDNFSTTNQFHGLDLGLRTRFNWENLSLTVLTKVALGHVGREITINGNTVTSVPGTAPLEQPGGFNALSTNSGNTRNGDWATMPELGLNLNWKINSNWQMRLGYSVLWLNRVGRAVDQLNPNINPNLLPNANNPGVGPQNPVYQFFRSDIFFQSVNIGLEYTF